MEAETITQLKASEATKQATHLRVRVGGMASTIPPTRTLLRPLRTMLNQRLFEFAYSKLMARLVLG